jgi:RNA recognition motif-containing protein
MSEEKEEKGSDQQHKIFVGQVPQDTGEEQLRKIFSPFGEIKDLLILRDRITGHYRGCAFITYSSREEGERAIEAVGDKVKLAGAKREMIVRWAGKNLDEPKEYKLYVGMLSRKTTEDELRKMFEPYGDVLEAFLMRNKDATNSSKGCGFIKYPTRDEAQRAINALHVRHRDKEAPGFLQVRFSHTKQEKQQRTQQGSVPPAPPPGAAPGGQWIWAPAGSLGIGPMGGFGSPPTPLPAYGAGAPGGSYGDYVIGPYGGYYQDRGAPAATPGGRVISGPSGANLFIYNLPENYTDQELGSLFSNFGLVLSATVQRDKLTGTSKGFGFISFDNTKSAQQAIASMDGFVLGSKRLNVRVKKGDGGSSGNGYAPY